MAAGYFSNHLSKLAKWYICTKFVKHAIKFHKIQHTLMKCIYNKCRNDKSDYGSKNSKTETTNFRTASSSSTAVDIKLLTAD